MPVRLPPALLLLSLLLGLQGCPKKAPSPPAFDPGPAEGAVWGPGFASTPSLPDSTRTILDSLVKTFSDSSPLPGIPFNYPLPRTVFPPEITPPVFSWSDSLSGSDFWVIEAAPAEGPPYYILTGSPALPPPSVDSAAISPGARIEIPDPNRFRNWAPGPELWEAMKTQSRERWLTLICRGFSRANPRRPRSLGRLVFKTSADSVKAPIFYRDVPIMPTRNETGRVQPLSKRAERMIRWRLRDVASSESRTVIQGLPTCANCHSFSRDGKTLGLDLDGPQNDKGTYGLARVSRNMDIGRKDVFSWNRGFQGKARGKNTIGFLSQVSPDGQYVATTVNEEVYIHNYLDNKYIQVFYPTRGILAFHSRKTGRIQALPGADDPAYVHCDPSWTPDGKHIVFARAPAKDPYREGQPDPKYPNDPNETQIQYSLYRIPFNGGKGGRAVPVAGASDNGMSNNFPKVTPDGRFIVFVKCRNGQLLRPDSKLWIVPAEGGEARLMDCNLPEMNSWHSFSPDGRWMVFSSKGYSYYTQMFLAHIDEEGRDSPPVLVANATAANRAVNLPEFANIPPGGLESIGVSAIGHMQNLQDAYDLLEQGRKPEARERMKAALEQEKEDAKFRAEVQVLLGWLQDSLPDRLAMTREAVRTDPGYPLAHFNLASLLEQEGSIAEAMRSYQKAIALDSGNAWALVSLARIRMQSEDPGIRDVEKAIQHAERANRLSKFREPSIMKTLARAYSEAGRFEEAVEMAGMGLALARQQNLPQEVQELETEAEVYRLRKSFTWALKQSQAPGARPVP